MKIRVTYAGAFLILFAISSPAIATQSNWCSINNQSFSSGSVPRHLVSELAKGPHPLASLHMDASKVSADQLKSASAFRGHAFHRLNVIQNSTLYGNYYHDNKVLAESKSSLLAWVSKYKPTYDPIDETQFDTLIRSYAILKPTLDKDQLNKLNNFFSNWGWGYLKEMQQHKEDWNNNFQSHRIKLVTMIAVATHDHAMLEEAKYYFELQIKNNIYASGMTRDFKQRDALHYVVYDLQPLVQAAIDAKFAGEDWYNWKSSTGSSLAKGITWLLPYVSGDKKHKEFVHSTHSIDKKRAEAHYAGFSGYFAPKSAATLMWLVSELDPSYESVAKHLEPRQPLYLKLCGQ